MKIYLVLFGLLVFAIPASPQCGVTVQQGMPSIIECPIRLGDICEIPLSCLKALAPHDWAAIRVYNGDTVYWISDLRDNNGALMKFKFKTKLTRVPKTQDGDCSDDQPNADAFEDGFPHTDTTQKPTLKKIAVVAMDAPYLACYKHSIYVDGAANDIDPHIIIGGQPPLTLQGPGGTVIQTFTEQQETQRRRKTHSAAPPRP